MTLHGKFIGRLITEPKTLGPKELGFTTLALALDGPNANGVNEVHALLDPQTLKTKEVAEHARKWRAGDLVRLEGLVVTTSKCECCDKPLAVVDALECSRVGH